MAKVIKPSSCLDYVRNAKNEWILKGQKVSGDIAKKLDNLRIPPAWQNVVVATNPKAKVVAIGQDVAGRWQYKYSAEHIAASAKKKFIRVKSFSRDITGIRKHMDQGVNLGDPRALLLRLEDKTAMRVGSMRDVKAKKKAYGLTTLKNEHVAVKGNKITLDFVAKKGVPAHYEITDDVLAEFLRERKGKTKVGEYLFPDVSGKKMNDYIREISGKSYTIKDYRTFHGTSIAFNELRPYSGKVLSAIDKKKLITEVSTTVSEFLHNTPFMARGSYIDPMVWEIIGGL